MGLFQRHFSYIPLHLLYDTKFVFNYPAKMSTSSACTLSMVQWAATPLWTGNSWLSDNNLFKYNMSHGRLIVILMYGIITSSAQNLAYSIHDTTFCPQFWLIRWKSCRSSDSWVNDCPAAFCGNLVYLWGGKIWYLIN